MTKPATPLPWDVQDDTEICSETGGVATTHAAESSVGTRTESEDATYIVTACNAYPQLVEDNKRLREALQKVITGEFGSVEGSLKYGGGSYWSSAGSLLAELDPNGGERK